MHALVTGAGGFLGRYIVEQLVARGDQVRGLVRKDVPELRHLGVELVHGDVRGQTAVAEACHGIDVVFHTAAVAGLAGTWLHYYETNTQGTEHVLAACRKHRVPKLVFTSSPSVTFAGVDQCGVDESAPYPTKWLAHYSHTKAIAEQKVLEANDDKLATCALRPHLIWGPRDSHLIPKLLERAKSGRLRQVGDGKNLVDICYVDNAAEAHLQAADALAPGSPVAGKVYFLSQGEPVNCWGWINEVLAQADAPLVTKRISYRAAYALGFVLEGIWGLTSLKDDPPMTRFLASQLATSHYFDISAARRDFGYSTRVSTEEGMRRMKASWAKNDQ
jgi:nucleoside-diphosphate-sugar epimerase